MNDRWDLSYLYHGFDDGAFLRDLGSFAGDARAIREGLRAPGTDRERLERALEAQEALSRKTDALANFIQCTLAVDAENAAADAAMDRLMDAFTEIELVSSDLVRAVDAVPDLEALLAESPALQRVAFALREMKARAAHLIPEAVEPWILRMQISGGDAFSQLRDKLDATLLIPFRGEERPLSAVRGMAYDADAKVREEAYRAELAAYPRIELPMSFCLNSIKMEARTLAEARGYASVLDMTLADSRMDRETLEALLSAIREALPDFRRYLRAKGRMLGHPDGLPFWDLFAPVGGSALTYTAEEARAVLLREMGKFTPEMAEFIDGAFENRWIDLYPRAGKTGGAFCSSVHYADRSLVMTNFQGSFSDVSTLAHELGHAWHNRCMAGLPYSLIDTPMPLAETASIFNETMLAYQVRRQCPEEARLALIENGLMEATQTVVDIYSRYLFEREVVDTRADHAMNAEELKAAMLRAQEASYGDGLAKDARHPYMWACKSHYYSSGFNFYNFPYAFGLLFGKGLFAQYLEKGEAFVPEYCRLLRACGMDSVAGVAARAGIDVRSADFWRGSLSVIREDIDAFCRIAEEKTGA